MRRAKPNGYRLAVWLALAVTFDGKRTTPARELWAAWKRYARRRRCEAGTPRSFSNALRRVGCPWRRESGRRTRVHVGLRLAPSTWPIPPDSHPIYATNERGNRAYVGLVHARYVPGECDLQPLIRVSRGLLPPTWEPARVLQRDGRWFLERAS